MAFSTLSAVAQTPTPRSSGAPAPRVVDPFAYGPIGGVMPTPDPNAVLFPQADSFLSPRGQKTRRTFLDRVSPLLERVLTGDEKVLYVAMASRSDGEVIAFHFTMGHFAPMMKQVALVFTSFRVLEIEVLAAGQKPGTAVRSYPWNAMREVKNRMLGLEGKPLAREHKAVRWTVSAFDRKLLKALIPVVQEKIVAKAKPWHGAFPVSHCAACGAFAEIGAEQCGKCRQLFKQKTTGMLVALTVPGGVYHYFGHHRLGGLFSVVEVLATLLAVAMATTADKADAGAMAAFAVVLIAILKVKDMVSAALLARRMRLASEAGEAAWRKGIFAGAAGLAVCLLLIGYGYTESAKREPPPKEAKAASATDAGFDQGDDGDAAAPAEPAPAAGTAP